jgi:hypothetical protein
MFDKAMTKSIQAYLQPGEELLNATIVQGKGLAKMTLAGGVVGAMAVAAHRDRKSAKTSADAPDGAVHARGQHRSPRRRRACARRHSRCATASERPAPAGLSRFLALALGFRGGARHALRVGGGEGEDQRLGVEAGPQRIGRRDGLLELERGDVVGDRPAVRLGGRGQR